MKILCATFDHNYYLWQSLVLINNLIKYGYDEDAVFIISTFNPSAVLKSMMNHPKIKCKFFLYKDERVSMKYPVTLRHYILEKFFIENPEYAKEVIFLIDPDMVFTKKLDFTEMVNDDSWHLSDTRSYIDSKYIKGKSEKLFNEMCDIVGVLPEEISAIDEDAGGAQYLLKGVDANFFHKTLYDSEKLFNHMKENESTGIQTWTADMWSILWNGVCFGHKIKVTKELEFCWSVDNIKRWDETYIFHNAGIPGDSKTHFSKITYQVSPFNKDIHSDNDNCTYKYIQEIKETEENFRDILW